MGPLNLPAGGLVYIDATSSLIYSMERVEQYSARLESMWQSAQDGNIVIVSSPLLVLEVLVKPIRDGNTEIEEHYRELFDSNVVTLLDASFEIFAAAANIRAETGLRTPDAIHAATAIRAGCALFVTNDTDFRRVENLPSAVLDDFLVS